MLGFSESKEKFIFSLKFLQQKSWLCLRNGAQYKLVGAKVDFLGLF